MKKFILLILVLINFQKLYSQGFVKPQEYVPFVKPYVPNSSIDEYKSSINNLNDIYDRNRAFHRKLAETAVDFFKKAKTDNSEIKILKRAISKKLLEIDDVGDYENRTDDLIQITENLNTAINIYKKIQQEMPQKLWDDGNKKIEINNFEGAVQDYTLLIEISPEEKLAYRNRGYSYYKLNKYNLALSDLNKYILYEQTDYFGYEQRAWVKNALGDFQGAKLDFDMAIELKSQNSYLYFGRGLTKSNLNDNQGAISDYTKAIKIDPTFSMAYNNRGWCKFELKLLKEALKDVQQAIILDSSNSVAFDSRQEIRFSLNDFAGCIKDCNKTLLLNPECANAYYFRGRANFKLNNKKTMCADWQKAVDLGKKEAYNLLLKFCSSK